MVHPGVRSRRHHEVRVRSQEGAETTYDYFIGRFESDEKLHLLGYRPTGSAYFSAESESSHDLGIVTLPDGKTHLGDLIEGDEIVITPQEKSGKTSKVFFQQFA